MDVSVVFAPCRVRFCVVEPTVNAPDGVILLVLMPANVGVALAAMFWMVLMTPPLALKLVLLNCAIPF